MGLGVQAGKGPLMTDQEKIAAILAPEAMAKRNERGREFAQEIAEKFGRMLDRGTVLSVRQTALLDRLVSETTAPQAQVGASFDGVRELFETAKRSGLKRPGLRVTVGDLELSLNLAPAHGRNPGAIYVKANGEYAGKVSEGEWRAAFNAPAAATDAVLAIAADPVGMAIQSGKATGACSFCRLGLTDERSVQVGYGPQCAEKWGLPWGGPKATGTEGLTAGQKAAATRRLRLGTSEAPAPQAKAAPAPGAPLTPGQKAAATRKLRAELAAAAVARVQETGRRTKR